LEITRSPSPPVALTIAGSDSSCGAGVQADIKTFAAHGVYGVNAVTALVAEAPGAVTQIKATDSTLLGAQLNRVGASFPIKVAKTGMLATRGNVEAVVEFCRQAAGIPLIIDPVVQASAGVELLSLDGLKSLCSNLLPLSTLVTPNLPEAAILLGCAIDSPEAAKEAPRRIFESYGCNALVKGGHASGNSEIVDYAWIDNEVIEFVHPRLDVPDVHGTGCTLSAAIAARIALGEALPEAISMATSYLAACLEQHFQWPESGGSESLNHFPNIVD
tara:strand:+ start:674 stop:1495 length:822 start_codon:yes stop_codon:yes gene_type:complete